MHTRHSLLASVIIVIVCLTGIAHAAPQIGDKAPAIKVAKWITEQPPAIPGEKKAEKHVFLIEFWATWCPPCIKSIPHLGDLQKKHKKAGLVVIGVSNEEPETISKFIDKKMKMPYHVASDDEMATTIPWTEGIPTIPHAFLVNKEGIVVWEGNPLDISIMDTVIEKVLAGKYDLDAAKNTAMNSRKYEKLMTELQPAYAMKDKDKIFDILDQLIAIKPLETHAYLIKRSMLAEFDMADQIPAWDKTIEEALKDSPEAMLNLASTEISKDFSDRRPAFLLRCARRASKLNKQRDANALALLARASCELGMIDEAIKAQSKAVAISKDEAKEYHEKVLTYYKAARDIAKKMESKIAKGTGSEKSK